MNSKILNSILNGELKPWLISFDDERVLKEIIKQVKNNPNETTLKGQANLNALLKPFPALLKGLNFTPMVQLQPQSFGSNLPEPVTLFNHFYKAIIDAEIARYFNATIHNPLIKDNTLDVPFQIGHQSLKGIAGLCNQTNNEIIERGFITNNTAITDTSFFALTYLRNSLLALYFAIQKPFKEHLTTTYNSFEDYALYCLDDANFYITITEFEIPKEIVSIAKSDNKAFNFGFKGDVDNLTNLIKVLCVHKNLLDENITQPILLIELLTTKDINAKSHKIKLGCKTNLFTYIIICLKKVLPKLTYANIERCGYFFSDNDTPIRQSVFSNSKSNNPISKETRAEIDKIFKENNI
jgi:hypothetical protein